MMMAEPLQPSSLRGAFTANEPMARHVTWRAGGLARYAFRPADRDDLVEFFRTHGALLAEFPPLFVGLGSNLLVRDNGIAATAIFMHPGLQSMAVVESDDASATIEAEAGVAAPKLARFAATHDLEGAEFLAGVPGTVGGALTMNAGCYGSETWEHALAAELIGADALTTAHPRAEFDIGYRHVAAKFAMLGRDAWFVAGRFRFRRGDGRRSRERIKELLSRRVATQPLQLPNAGSVFRNPPGDHAARLIESCGLKGFAIGGAQVSVKHANFIVNPGGGATAADIEHLITHVQATVEAHTAITLEPEVRIVGAEKGVRAKKGVRVDLSGVPPGGHNRAR
ncbi:MAG: UDP-N-acetylmuramate dehydrogenase [Betaproteobacteria bacterium]